ncbi:MAG: DUF6273 domain-containing protein [Candidatus Gastranaerophilales bacterium]|nr:DUF6273 domain-containing protein [Candidatus Gastranaerophilales bacterium]
MIKKILIGCFTAFVLAFQVYAVNYFDILNQVNSTIDTINRAGQYIPKNTDTTTQTPEYPSNQDRYPAKRKYYPRYNDNYSSSGQSNAPDNMPEQQQTVPQGRQYNQAKDYGYQGEATTLGALPAGTLVMDPNSIWNFRRGDNNSGEIYLKHPIFWRKLEDNHYTNGATLLLSEFYVQYDWCHSQKGLRAWNESDVRRFLRTTFYNHLSPGFQNAIVNVNIPYANLEGKPETVLDNLFLLSIVEWGASDRANNGKVIKYDNLPAIYGAKEIRYIDSWNSYDIDGKWYSLTRTINRPEARSAGYTSEVFTIESDGTLSTHWITVDIVRPAVNLKSTTKVKGPYQFNYYVYGKKHFIYYELDFSSAQ